MISFYVAMYIVLIMILLMCMITVILYVFKKSKINIKKIEPFSNYKKDKIYVDNIYNNKKDSIHTSDLDTIHDINLKKQQYISGSGSYEIKVGDTDKKNTLLKYYKNTDTPKGEVHIGNSDKDLDLSSKKIHFEKPVGIEKNTHFNNVNFKNKVVLNNNINLKCTRNIPKICFGTTEIENCLTEDDIKTLLSYSDDTAKFIESIQLLRGVYVSNNEDADCDNTKNSNSSENGIIIPEKTVIDRLGNWVKDNVEFDSTIHESKVPLHQFKRYDGTLDMGKLTKSDYWVTPG